MDLILSVSGTVGSRAVVLFQLGYDAFSESAPATISESSWVISA